MIATTEEVRASRGHDQPPTPYKRPYVVRVESLLRKVVAVAKRGVSPKEGPVAVVNKNRNEGAQAQTGRLPMSDAMQPRADKTPPRWPS